MAILKHKLRFAKEFGWTDQNDVVDPEADDITNLHSRNEVDIPLCNCHRCLRFKTRKKAAIREQELNRRLRPEEYANINNSVIEETDRARRRAQMSGIYL